MFTWVAVTQIDTSKHKIYNTLWAYKIKLNSDLTLNKLNPRWCIKGGTMDRDIYKSHAETLKITSYRILLALVFVYFSEQSGERRVVVIPQDWLLVGVDRYKDVGGLGHVAAR